MDLEKRVEKLEANQKTLELYQRAIIVLLGCAVVGGMLTFVASG